MQTCSCAPKSGFTVPCGYLTVQSTFKLYRVACCFWSTWQLVSVESYWVNSWPRWGPQYIAVNTRGCFSGDGYCSGQVHASVLISPRWDIPLPSADVLHLIPSSTTPGIHRAHGLISQIWRRGMLFINLQGSWHARWITKQWTVLKSLRTVCLVGIPPYSTSWTALLVGFPFLKACLVFSCTN